MTRRHARTDLLDRVSVPDLWPDIQRRAPGSPGEVGPPSNGRPAAVAVALIVAILGVGLSVYALSGVRHAGGPVGPSPAAPPTGPLIAFTTASRDSGVNPDLRIAVMRPDGSEVTRLTTGQEPDTYITRYGYSQDLDPEWSPDGQTIYFLRRYSESVYSLCSVTSSGKGFDIIVRDFPSGEFALSPAGTQVAFAGGSRDARDGHRWIERSSPRPCRAPSLRGSCLVVSERQGDRVRLGSPTALDRRCHKRSTHATAPRCSGDHRALGSSGEQDRDLDATKEPSVLISSLDRRSRRDRRPSDHR